MNYDELKISLCLRQRIDRNKKIWPCISLNIKEFGLLGYDIRYTGKHVPILRIYLLPLSTALKMDKSSSKMVVPL